MFVLLSVSISMAEESDVVKSMGFEYVEFDNQMVPVGKEVSVESATSYVKDKGAVMINFLTTIAKPITLVVMVVCGLMAIISGLTGMGQKSGAWVVSSIISAFCYCGVTLSPLILELIVQFVKPV